MEAIPVVSVYSVEENGKTGPVVGHARLARPSLVVGSGLTLDARELRVGIASLVDGRLTAEVIDVAYVERAEVQGPEPIFGFDLAMDSSVSFEPEMASRTAEAEWDSRSRTELQQFVHELLREKDSPIVVSPDIDSRPPRSPFHPIPQTLWCSLFPFWCRRHPLHESEPPLIHG